ncbi:B3 domain-containing protein At3g25182-like [Sesamum indicum]|uniref:B3 domain-containing protein At3g25182-like n=1 Tax=Sesamum indicum TaxID=4182 RepID=A0A8M8VDA8_SESIN|nr:B3 domain-containing protein At3g25182-like [Sesamum indicum]
MEGVVTSSHNRFDILAATAQRALQLLQQQEEAQRQETKMQTEKRKRERRSTEYADGEGEPTAARRKKPKQHEEAQRQETKMKTAERKRERRSTEYADGDGEPTAARRKKPKQHEEAQRQETKMKTAERKRDRRSTEYADGEEEPTAARRKKPNTRKNKKQPVDDGPQPPPPLPERFKNVIREISGGRIVSEETLVIQKALFQTDLNSSHNRLSIPFSQISHHGFLTDEEKKFLRCREGKGKKKHKDVTMIEPSLKTRTATLSRWDMPKEKGKMSSIYVIHGPWTSIVTGNQLKVGMVVQLWALRIGEELCFALVNLTGEGAA